MDSQTNSFFNQKSLSSRQHVVTLLAGTTEDVLLVLCQDFVHKHVIPQEVHNRQQPEMPVMVNRYFSFKNARA